ncbi:hypothetical protein BHM03_00056461 [Ensete ventricosum]|nr:hypothetical protein BHM03_00056461 [Ensete ventricosum]
MLREGALPTEVPLSELKEATRGSGSERLEEEGELDGILNRVEEAIELCKKARRKDDPRDFRLLVAQIRVMKRKHDDSHWLCQGVADGFPALSLLGHHVNFVEEEG